MCLLFLITSVDITDKCKMCGSTDDSMNNSTCNWVNYTKFYTTSFHCYCRCNVMIVVVGFMSYVCTDLEYSELSTSTKFSCIECTNSYCKSFFYPLTIKHAYDIACYISAVDTNNAWCHGNHS